MKNTKRKHLKICLLLLFMVLGCFTITNVRTTTVQTSSRTLQTGCEIVKISHLQIFLWKEIVFSSADDEGTGITCTYTKGKNGFKLERSKMVLTERSGRYAVGYICMIVYTIL